MVTVNLHSGRDIEGTLKIHEDFGIVTDLEYSGSYRLLKLAEIGTYLEEAKAALKELDRRTGYQNRTPFSVRRFRFGLGTGGDKLDYPIAGRWGVSVFVEGYLRSEMRFALNCGLTIGRPHLLFETFDIRYRAVVGSG